MKSEADDHEDSGGKSASASYPYMPLASALKIGAAVNELGGMRSEVQKNLLASHLQEAEKSAVLQQRLSSAKAFGLIEGFGAYRLTDLAKRFYFPTSNGDKPLALLQMLASPEAFGGIIRRFDGSKLPSRDILANIFHRELHVPTSWKDRAAAYFCSSAEYANALDAHGFLRHGVNMQRASSHDAAQPTTAHASSEPRHEMPPQPSEQIADMTRFPRKQEPASPGNKVFVWPYQGSYIRLETPENMPLSLWEKLRGYVELLKPEGEQK